MAPTYSMDHTRSSRTSFRLNGPSEMPNWRFNIINRIAADVIAPMVLRWHQLEPFAHSMKALLTLDR